MTSLHQPEEVVKRLEVKFVLDAKMDDARVLEGEMKVLEGEFKRLGGGE